MATILKWWKMRMLGGYKHMSGLMPGSDCEHSATEGSQRSSRCCPGHHCNSSTDETRLYESEDEPEDECSVASDETARAEELTRPMTPATPATPDRPSPKDEFNFTLYDFDGHGKLTKDDIAGLVKAIYDVVGSSVHVPPSGSKTIHVKLTVTPEQQQQQQRATTDPTVSRPAEQSGGQHRDLSITIRSDTGTTAGADAAARWRGQLDVKTKLLETPRRTHSHSVRGGVQSSVWRARSPEAEGSPVWQGRHLVTDSSRRRQLVEMLQHSMESNNLKFNHLKRHNSDRDHLRHRTRINEPTPAQHYTVSELAFPNGSEAAPLGHTSCSQCVRDRWTKRHAACRAARCQPAGHAAKQPEQQRRCYEEDDYELLTRCAEFALRDAQEKQHAASRAARAGRPRAAPVGIASPHHQMKHRNRERDHYRAMQQVLSWLEREHPAPSEGPLAADPASPCRCDDPSAAVPDSTQPPPTPQSPQVHLTPPNPPQGEASPPPPPPRPKLTEQKVEHHHMHEHVHHHYHHFPKGAVIL